MAADLVGSYLKNIGRYPLLTSEEEIFYAAQIQSMLRLEKQAHAIAQQLGRDATVSELAASLSLSETEIHRVRHRGQKVKHCMATANLRLVVVIAKKYQKSTNMDFIDLIQEGFLGLHRGIEKFDPTKGYKFSTYAYWWVRQGITRGIAEKARMIHLPVNLIEKLNKIKRTQAMLSQSLGRLPTIKEIAATSNISEQKIIQCLKHSNDVGSLDLCIGKDKETELIEILESPEITPVEQIELESLSDGLNEILSSLTTKQRRVLILRYGINSGDEKTLSEVGQELSLSQQRVSQIHDEALRKLKRQHAGTEYSF